MPVHILDTPEAVGAASATRILDGLARAQAEDRAYLLGCPTGRTPEPVYRALADRLAADPTDLHHLVLVMMDEYLVDGRLAPVDAHFSCRGFAERRIRAVLNDGLPEAMHLPAGNVWFPDPADPGAYDRRIAGAGGIDLFIVASGASDGHVAFNPQGTPHDARTRVIELAEQTRVDNMQTFPDFASLAQVPTHGISVGPATIADARAALLLVWGADKRTAFDRVRRAGGYDSDWPATIALESAECNILADQVAAGEKVE